MVSIHFRGFFQCRLATDPDDFDHPRGAGGWTFAYAGEDDLDRVIRFHAPVSPRRFAPAAGVLVVDVDGSTTHELVGAQVSLLENAKFEGRNGLIAPAGKEPVSPFVLEIAKPPFQLRRRDDYDVTKVAERRAHLGLGLAALTNAEATALGVANPVDYRERRRRDVEAAAASEPDPIKKAILAARLNQLANFSTAVDIQTRSLTFKVPYKHQLRHAATVTDPGGLLPGAETSAPWEMSYWFGSWDADALQAFVDGTIAIPTI